MGKIDHFKIVGHYGGTTSCVRVQGTSLFCGFGPELAIFDISTPEKPELRANVLLDEMSIIKNIYVTDRQSPCRCQHCGYRMKTMRWLPQQSGC